MNKKTLRDVELAGKRVLMRVDFNVPIKDGKVTDDTRIKAALPSIKYCLEHGASVVLMSHLGRPKGGKVEPEFSLRPVADRLHELLGIPVAFAPDCIGDDARRMAAALKPGQVLLLENTRFYAEEEGKAKVADDASEDQKKAAKAEMKAKQKAMAEKLAQLGDIYCNDAFGSAHRAHASTAVVCQFFKDNVAGFLMEKEIDYLCSAVENPARPFVAILGGAKVSDKIPVIENLLKKADAILIGGAMAYTFLKAKGVPVGLSLVEDEFLETVRSFMNSAAQTNKLLLLPLDHVVAPKFGAEDQASVTPGEAIPSDQMGLDIGPKTIARYAAEIAKAKTIVWNGPMGVFEQKAFANGTFAIAKAIAQSSAVSIVGGGDSVAAVNQSGVADKITHISTGGGASLELLEGKVLPGVAALSDK
ncbi:MAG: phosphoglycerate kinase [bacterium]|nr:phosphoglycerate kinase [bacterium]